MKSFFRSFTALCTLLAGAPCALADGGVINIDVSVKFIQNSNGNDPFAATGGTHHFNSDADVQTEIDRGNTALRNTFRGYRLNLVETLRIKPTKPAAETDLNYWYTLDARSNRAVFEAAAKASKTVWKWHESAINIYINDSGSGQCSFVGHGESISLGVTIYANGTTVHEIGHFFNLSHTHSGDPLSVPVPFTSADLSDGDSLTETRTDHAKASADQLSQVVYGQNYSALNATQKADIDTVFENVMSYHNENELLEQQMNIWTDTANDNVRHKYVRGTTRFVDSSVASSGFGTSSSPIKVLGIAVTAASTSERDILLLRPGTYTATTISKPLVLRATRTGPATIQHP